MKKENFFSDNDDIQFQFTKRMDYTELFKWVTPMERETVSANSPEEYAKVWDEVLSGYGEFSASEIAPNSQKVEREDLALVDGEVKFGPTIADNVKGYIELGAPALGVGPEYGGLGAPLFVEMAACEIGNRACPSTMLNTGWWGPISAIIEQFGSEELKAEYCPKIATGEFSGSMSLTEPDAGSDLGGIRTYGDMQADGTWRLFGAKRFISNGNGDVSLVLAKNKKGATGLDDLSLFLCPARIDGKRNFTISKLEEKVGLHGSATCELVFDNSKAFILGENGQGFQYMLRLMNDSRMGVAFQGLGLMEAAFRMAAEYANERKTWGKPIAHHELIAEKLLDMEVETKAFRSLCYQAAYNRTLQYAGERYLEANPNISESEKKDIEKKIKRYGLRVRRWTPLVKYWAGEKSVEHARNALQIHGGYGFTKEYRAEWWVRESLIYSLYEGTSQIQALMCMKDTLKEVVQRPRAFFEAAFGFKVKGFSEPDPLRKKLYKMKETMHNAVVAILFRLMKTNVRTSMSEMNGPDILNKVKSLSKDLMKFDSLQPALLHAERICEMKCLIAITEAAIWDAEADSSRTWIAERMANIAGPKVAYLKSQIDVDDPVIDSRLAGYSENSK
jgi:alkylation response protein AidB-like acyl-CoA dehydrogenase